MFSGVGVIDTSTFITPQQILSPPFRMAGAVMDSIVILDDDEEEASTSASTSYSHATNCQSKTPVKNQLPPPTHISQSPFASAKKDVHVLQAENQKLFAEVHTTNIANRTTV